MDDWFSLLNARRELPADIVENLLDIGFVVIPGPVPPDRMAELAEAYDFAMANAAPEDVGIGSTTTRVHDFVNRGPEFDGLYVYGPVLEACCRVLAQPFRLSSMLGRTLRPYSQAQGLHVDFEADAKVWTMVGFILMVDEFRADNGATQFVPGSHRWATIPPDLPKDLSVGSESPVPACGPAGSMIVYNGSTWHGHSANRTGEPRRSIQGAYIRRTGESWINQTERIRPETLGRIGDLARYVLAI